MFKRLYNGKRLLLVFVLIHEISLQGNLVHQVFQELRVLQAEKEIWELQGILVYLDWLVLMTLRDHQDHRVALAHQALQVRTKELQMYPFWEEKSCISVQSLPHMFYTCKG